MRKPSGNSVIPATIHKYFGSAWDVIKDLYDNLAELLGLTPLVPIADDLVDIAENIDEILLVNTNAEEFNKHFLGAHAAEPTVDGNGDPLAEGAQYWNTENDLMYTFDGTQWVLTSGFGTVTLTSATGNGVTTAFNLDIAPKSVNNTSVFIQGVYQEKDTYTITGKQVVFNEAPLDGLSIEIVAVLASSFVSGSDKEYKTLTSGQTVVAFDAAIGFATFYVSGDDTDSKRLILGTDYTSDLGTNEITLEDGYPAGTVIEMVYGFADDIPIDIANLRDLIDANTALINTNIDNITLNANAIETINNSLTKVFDSVAELTGTSTSAISLEEGQRVGRYYHTKGDAGYAEGIIKTPAQAASEGVLIDGRLNVPLENGNVWVADTTTSVKLSWFGAKQDLTYDSTAEIQAAIVYCILTDTDLVVNGEYRIDGTCYIDKSSLLVGAYKNLNIVGDSGVFYTEYTAAGNPVMFSASLGERAHLVHFQNITFRANEGGPADGTSTLFVMQLAKFVRVTFTGCNFDKMKLSDATDYIQSVYLDNCNIRQWAGKFLKTATWAFDVHVTSCMIENSYGSGGVGGFISLKSPQGCSLHGNVIEGIPDAAIQVYSTKALSVVGNYFEGNYTDINTASADPNYGLFFAGNTFSDIFSSTRPAVYWSDGTVKGVSIGNNAPISVDGLMHLVAETADVYIMDTAYSVDATTYRVAATDTGGGQVTRNVIEPANMQSLSDSTPAILEAAASSSLRQEETANIDLDPAASTTMATEVVAANVYKLYLTCPNGANALWEPPSEYIVVRQGTGFSFAPVVASGIFSVTLDGNFNVVITNNAGAVRTVLATLVKV